jgi:hypothetical protein
MRRDQTEPPKTGLGPVASVLLALALLSFLGLANIWVFSNLH